MKRFSEQFNKQAHTCKLTATERADIRSRVVSYMEYQPLQNATKAIPSIKVQTAAGFEIFHTFNLPWVKILRGVTGAAVIILVIVPILAERAVPGDTLYAVKVGLTEEMRSTLSFTPSQRVVWETTRLNRRIAEAQLLESKGELTEAVEADVAAAVKEHTDNAQREIAALRAVDTDEATLVELELTTTLAVHTDAMRNRMISATTDDMSTSTTEISNVILSALDTAQLTASDATGSTTVPSYEKLVARVEQHTTRLFEVLKAVEKTSTADEFRDATRRVSDIDRAIDAAFTLSERDKPAAQQSLIEVLQRSQRLLVYLTNLEVRSKVTLESIVPIELTDEEEQSKIDSLTTTLAGMVTYLESVTATATPQTEKVLFALNQITEIKTRLASTTVTDTNTQVIHELETAIQLAESAKTLLDRYEVAVPKEIESDVTSSTTTATSTEPVVGENGVQPREGDSTQASSTDQNVEALTAENEGV